MPARAFKLFFVENCFALTLTPSPTKFSCYQGPNQTNQKNYGYMRKKLTSVSRLPLKRKGNQLAFLLVFQFAVFINGYSQSVTVKGVVQDEKGSVLAGATVAVKGSVSSVVTDNAGKYSIAAPGGESVLVFSFIKDRK